MEPPGPHLRAELAKRGAAVGLETAAAAFRAEIAYYLEHHIEGHDRASLDELRDRCARVMSEALGDPPVDVRAAMLAAIRFDAFPEVPHVLRELRARGLRLIVASNWDCSLGEVLRDAGVRDLVDGVVTSAEVGAAKPDARLFAAALERAGCAAEEAVHVGDSPDGDIRGAAGAGLRPVLIDRRGGGARPGLEAARIASLAELPPLLFG
jgi:putative hydrolase of the HAD superfamily